MKKAIYFCMITAMCIIMGACSSSDDEPRKIELAKDQSANMRVPANQYSGEIKFIASAAWSAWTSTDSRGVDDVEWIHLNDKNGSAGSNTLSFTLDNNTGEDRTAYIVIVCEDSKVSVTITQTTEDDPDNYEGNIGMVDIVCESYQNNAGQGYVLDKTTFYKIEFAKGLPVKMVSEWRDDIDTNPNQKDQDTYCMNVESAYFKWNGNNVLVDMSTDVIYYPSKRHETEDASQHYAEFDTDGARHMKKGWYRWMEDPIQSDWTASYNADGYLLNTKNNDASSEWNTYTYTWENGSIKSISGTDGRRVTFTYADPSLLNLHREFDINWVLPKELECYDFAAGDITKMFTVFGLMGNPSKLLITEVTEYEDDDKTTYSYRMTYKENTYDKTVVRVTYFMNGIQWSYQDWTVKYNSIN